MARVLPILAVCLMLLGCSVELHTPPHILCRDLDGCPSDAELSEALWIFHDVASAAFDPEDDLSVYWHPEDTVFWERPDGVVIGYTDSPYRIHVTSVPVLVHEVMHAHLWRMFPEYGGDADHEDGDGPWTEATNEAIRAVVLRLELDQ